MDCILVGDVGAPLLGVSTGEKFIGIDTLLTTRTDLLRNANDMMFVLNDGVLDLTVKDNDDLWAVAKLAEIYKAFKYMNKNRILTNLIPQELDNNQAKEFKKSVVAFVSGNFGKATGITLEQLNAMFVDRFNFELMNTDSGYFAPRREVLKMQNILANTSEEVKAYIKKFLNENEEVIENRRVVNDNQKIFFYATDKSVMPEYEDVVGIVTDDLDEYRIKALVPKFHKYIGPFVNYQKGKIGETSAYVDGEYIKRAFVAEIMNDLNYKALVVQRRAELAAQSIGDKKVSITSATITGSSEYDADPINDNERDYYEELCKWEDMCIVRDILEAPIEEWVKLGLDINAYIPDLPITRRVKPFNGLNPKTFEMVDDTAEGFTMKDLESYGLTVEVFRGLKAGSPTANKWFRYAINVALIATRYYTGCVETPFGYDRFDFDKGVTVSDSFDEKYTLYMNNKIIRGRAIVDAESIGANSEKDDAPTFEDYGDITSDRGIVYWLGYDLSEDEDNKEDSASSLSNKVLVKDVDLVSVVWGYILNSGVEHALPEALIKCLRFGSNKPQSLQLDSIASRVNLTTGELIANVDLTNPIEYEAGKTSIIRSFVTVGSINDDVKSLLREATGLKSFGPTIIGVDVCTRYSQPDGSIVKVHEYYDMQTLVNNTGLQETIANLKDGVIIESSPVSESVEEVMQNVSRNVTTMSIQMNDAILSNLISGYQDKLTPDVPAYKIMNNINRAGFNMYTFASSLSNLKELTKNIKFIRMGKVVDKLKVTQSSAEIQSLLNAEMLVRYGNIISKCMQITATGNEGFNNTYKMWQSEVNYGLELTSINSGVNTVNVVDEYRKKVNDVVQGVVVQSGKGMDTKWNIIAIKMSPESKSPTFYVMGNSNVTKKMIVMSAKMITKDALSLYDNNPTKVMSQPVAKLVGVVKAVKAKPEFNSVPVEKIIDMHFVFVDEDTKATFTTIVVNNMRG